MRSYSATGRHDIFFVMALPSRNSTTLPYPEICAIDVMAVYKQAEWIYTLLTQGHAAAEENPRSPVTKKANLLYRLVNFYWKTSGDHYCIPFVRNRPPPPPPLPYKALLPETYRSVKQQSTRALTLLPRTPPLPSRSHRISSRYLLFTEPGSFLPVKSCYLTTPSFSLLPVGPYRCPWRALRGRGRCCREPCTRCSTGSTRQQGRTGAHST